MPLSFAAAAPFELLIDAAAAAPPRDADVVHFAAAERLPPLIALFAAAILPLITLSIFRRDLIERYYSYADASRSRLPPPIFAIIHAALMPAVSRACRLRFALPAAADTFRCFCRRDIVLPMRFLRFIFALFFAISLMPLSATIFAPCRSYAAVSLRAFIISSMPRQPPLSATYAAFRWPPPIFSAPRCCRR